MSDFGVWISIGMLTVKSKLNCSEFIGIGFLFLLFFINQKMASRFFWFAELVIKISNTKVKINLHLIKLNRKKIFLFKIKNRDMNPGSWRRDEL